MSGRNEQEYLFQEAARRELARGRIDRRDFLTRSLLTGLGLTGVGAVAKSGITPALAADRPLTPTFYQWIQDLHPGIPAVNAKFPGINYQIAPVEGFSTERFVAEAKDKQSTWDVYVGQTPFVEMTSFINADVSPGTITSRKTSSMTSCHRSAKSAPWTESSTAGLSCWM